MYVKNMKKVFIILFLLLVVCVQTRTGDFRCKNLGKWNPDLLGIGVRISTYIAAAIISLAPVLRHKIVETEVGGLVYGIMLCIMGYISADHKYHETTPYIIAYMVTGYSLTMQTSIRVIEVAESKFAYWSSLIYFVMHSVLVWISWSRIHNAFNEQCEGVYIFMFAKMDATDIYKWFLLAFAILLTIGYIVYIAIKTDAYYRPYKYEWELEKLACSSMLAFVINMTILILGTELMISWNGGRNELDEVTPGQTAAILFAVAGLIIQVWQCFGHKQTTQSYSHSDNSAAIIDHA